MRRRPPLRDRIQPFGFDTSDRQTEDGNILAHRSFQIGYVAAANGAIAIIEKPHSSKMKYLPSVGNAASACQRNVDSADSCQFGSIHLKSFVFLGINVGLRPLALRCNDTCNHVPVQGVFTKKSHIALRKGFSKCGSMHQQHQM